MVYKVASRGFFPHLFKRQSGLRNHGVAIPEIGHWYRRVNGNLFEVVAVDNDQSTVELQHFDGTIEGLEMDMWRDIDLEPVQAPEDWTGSVDIDVEGLLNPDRSFSQGCHDPLEFIDTCD